MKTFNYDEPSISDYLGDVLRGNVPPNQLIPQHLFLLNTLQLRLSETLINSIRKGMDEHQRILEWNLQHANPTIFSLMNGG